MPDDTALPALNSFLRGFDGKVLIRTTKFFNALVEYHKIMNQLKKSLFIAKLYQLLIEQLIVRPFIGFFPFEVVFFAGSNGAIPKAFGIISSHHQLHTRKESLNEFGFLIIEILTDTFRHAYLTALEFNNTQSNAINIENQIGSLLKFTHDRNFLSNSKFIEKRIGPVDEPNPFGKLPQFFSD